MAEKKKEKKAVKRVGKAHKAVKKAAVKHVAKKEKTKRHKTAAEKALAKLKFRISKKTHPVFRGRFGTKHKRSCKIEKWQKWRNPKGEDIRQNLEDGAIVKMGYRCDKDLRYLHPSGLKEFYVRNLQELKHAPKDHVIRLQSTLGGKQRALIKQEAEKLGLRILNL